MYVGSAWTTIVEGSSVALLRAGADWQGTLHTHLRAAAATTCRLHMQSLVHHVCTQADQRVCHKSSDAAVKQSNNGRPAEAPTRAFFRMNQGGILLQYLGGSATHQHPMGAIQHPMQAPLGETAALENARRAWHSRLDTCNASQNILYSSKLRAGCILHRAAPHFTDTADFNCFTSLVSNLGPIWWRHITKVLNHNLHSRYLSMNRDRCFACWRFASRP